jgi:hypothetical protein
MRSAHSRFERILSCHSRFTVAEFSWKMASAEIADTMRQSRRTAPYAFDLINTDRPGHVEPLRDLVCDRCAVLGRRSRGACDQVRRQSLERSCRCREAIEVDPTRHRSSASLLSTLTFDLPADQLPAPGDNGYGPELLQLAVTVETHTPTVFEMLSG